MSDLINLKKYPIDQQDTHIYRSLVLDCRATLAADKLLNLEDFLSQQATEKIAEEIDTLIPLAFHSCRSGSPYGLSEPNDLPADHPYNIKSPTDRFGLARHQLQGTLLDAVYQWEPVRQFVGDVVGLESIFLHEDPSNSLVVQIYKNKGGLAWHFDRALFSTILNIRETSDGGVFECVPDMRTDEDQCFDEVRRVLTSKSDRVEQYNVKSGSFTIMYGRYTLHRVTENRSDTPRLSAVLSYEDQPGVKLDSATRQLFFGPTAPHD